MANLDLIQKRFNETRKIFGHSDEITTASGVKIRGRYLLTESGAVTPSHDPMNGFQKSIGFQGRTRDYKANRRQLRFKSLKLSGGRLKGWCSAEW